MLNSGKGSLQTIQVGINIFIPAPRQEKFSPFSGRYAYTYTHFLILEKPDRHAYDRERRHLPESSTWRPPWDRRREREEYTVFFQKEHKEKDTINKIKEGE